MAAPTSRLQAADTTVAVLDAAAAQVAQRPDALEQVMLSQDKLYVVLAVVLVVWLGVLFLLVRTDRRLGRVERELDRLDASAPDR